MPPKLPKPKVTPKVTPKVVTPEVTPQVVPIVTPPPSPSKKVVAPPADTTVDPEVKKHISHVLKFLTKLKDQVDTQLSKSAHISCIGQKRDTMVSLINKECDELRNML